MDEKTADLIRVAVSAAVAETRDEMQATATAAARAVLQELGVYAEPNELPELRRDFQYLRDMRRTHEKIGLHVKLVLFGAVALAALGALWTGFASKISSGG
jgi:hypothetical protein